jgi:D-alanine transaminase
MESLGYYNGESGPLEEMRVPMNDRACWFGDGVYDATISANYRVFALQEHIDRFFNSAAMVNIVPPFSKEELAGILSSLIHKVDSPNQLVYWQLSRGTAARTHTFPEGVKPNLWITLRPYNTPDIFSTRVQLVTVEDTRYLHCNIKTLNLIVNALAAEEAKQRGAYEAVFHRAGRVTECSHCNVHIIKNGVLRTAPADNLILPGIARAHIIAHCKTLQIPADESPFTLAELFDADEVLISSSGTFCLAANSIDGRPVGGKDQTLLRRLQESLIEEFRIFCT